MENVIIPKSSKKYQPKEAGASKKNNSWLLLIVITVLSGFLLYQTYKSISLTMQKLGIYSQAQEDVDVLRLKNLELLLESNKVKTDYYVESEGRDRLHLSKDDEFVFIIPEELMESDELNAYYKSFTETEIINTYPGGWRGWLHFLFQGI